MRSRATIAIAASKSSAASQRPDQKSSQRHQRNEPLVKPPRGNRSMRAAIDEAAWSVDEFINRLQPALGNCRGAAFCAPAWRSIHLLEQTDFFKSPKVLDDRVKRNGTVFRGDSVANLLHVALPIGEVQHFVGVFFAGARQAFVAQQFWRFYAGGLRMIRKIVVAEHRQRPLRLRFAPKNNG